MDETKVRQLLQELYVHVAALPWKETGFVKDEAWKKAAEAQIIDHTVRKIIELSEEK